MKISLLILSFIPFNFLIIGQEIPKNTNLITVRGITFMKALNTLLDLEYEIDKKDIELQTASTKMILYHLDHGFRLTIRVVDSVVYIKGFSTWPYKNLIPGLRNDHSTLYEDKRVYYETNRKGKFKAKSSIGYVFKQMQILALKLGGETAYIKQDIE